MFRQGDALQEQKKMRQTSFGVAAAAATIFCVDLLSPLGVATGCLYVIPISIAFRTRQRNVVLLTGAGCIALVLVGAAFSPTGGEWLKVVANRGISLFVIFATALLHLRVMHANQATMRVESRMQTMLESMTDAVVAVDPDGRVIEWTARADSMLGWQRSEAVGRPVSELIVPEQYLERHQAGLARVRAGGQPLILGQSLELEAVRKDGAHFPIELTVSCDSTSPPSLYVASLRDITRRKAAADELENSKQELARSNTDLDQFAYAASHDLKAPLRAVDSLACWIEEDAGDLLPEASRDDLATLRGRIGRMSKLLDALLEYSRVGRADSRVEEIDLNELVADIIALNAPPVEFQIEYESLPVVFSQRAPLTQVLTNLILNAVKHHPGPTGRVVLGATLSESAVEITVADDGSGIDPAFHERIFRLFQSLHGRDATEGSGVGLALVRKHIDQNGGDIRVESELGSGATFRVTWKLATPSSEASAEEKDIEA